MWPTSEEYYNLIRNSKFIKFQESHKSIKKYINISIGFYGACSYHPEAWDETFKSIRKHFPLEPIVLIEDGSPCGIDYGDMAKKYNATYIKESDSIYLFWPKLEQTWKYLQWILKVADITQTEWLIQLHPDNICNDKISIFPPGPLCGVGAGSRNGISNNKLPSSAIKFIQKLHPNLEMNGYGWCGGSCIHVPTFKNIMKDFSFHKLQEISLIDKHLTLHEDLFLPFLFNMYGYPYRVWLEIEEPNRFEAGFGVSAAFQHANKTFYKIDTKVLEEKIQKEVNESMGTSFFYKNSDIK